MAFNHFIPTLWSSALLQAWQNATVFAGLVNRSYEGLATKGNTVKIAGVVVPTVHDYAAANRTTSAEAISDIGVDLLIDQEKSIDFYVDDIDRKQAAGDLASYVSAAGQALAVDSDKYIANAAVAHGTEVSGSLPTTGDQAFDLLNEAHKVLTKANAPAFGRVTVVNAEFAALLRTAASKLTTFYEAGDTAGLRAGTIGSLLGSRIVESNSLPEMDEPQFVLFDSQSIGYVSQIDEVEALRAQDRFADRVRMLHVYGAKVVRPAGVTVFNPASGS
ncbi:P22 phage major capsid protein family protein [Mycobacterium sp. 1245801.1]|uniref:P22 phage major capsid protein family protein n=1 Tax=Mycobacterium sp. 1245801.1 TaxID=1834075 RepID=UPI0007FD1FF2|nr:P22 phage major capsid protein family protein [Mycobacterium sp. 1245801.1]OBJ26965.1 hypothetical protein A5622_07755 [Mycobacterium sp. 1245801.1]